jgi:hypothetical protein
MGSVVVISAPDGLGSVVVDARMIDGLLPNLFMIHPFLSFGEMCMLGIREMANN